ncbi:hypothetical protein D3C87_1406710 [compost metagenome]
MAFQVFHVFEQECGRSLRGDNSGNVEKQSALGLAFETVFAPQGVFLGYACQGKWLARKTCQQDIVIRNFASYVLVGICVTHFGLV